MTTSWDPQARTAIVWARQIAAQRGLVTPPAEDIWAWAVADPQRAAQALERHRLVAASARTLSDLDSIPTGLAEWLRLRNRELSLYGLVHVGVANRFREALESAGIEGLFVKGAFQSAQATGDAGFRGPGDVDILVSPDRFDDVVELMTGLGAVHVQYDGTPELQKRVATVHHATSLRFHNTHIDLHHRLSPDPHLMRAAFGTLWARRDVVTIDRYAFPTTSLLDTAAHVASHGCQDNWPALRHVLDFTVAVDAARARFGWAAVHDRAAELGVPRRLATAIEVARMLQPDLPDQGPRARAMARWAWSRHRQGRMTFGSHDTRDVISSFAYWTLSEGDPRSLAYGVRRLMWLPSAMGDSPLPESMWWAYPVMAPVNVVRRIIERRALHRG